MLAAWKENVGNPARQKQVSHLFRVDGEQEQTLFKAYLIIDANLSLMWVAGLALRSCFPSKIVSTIHSPAIGTVQFDDQLIHVALVPNKSTTYTSPLLLHEAQPPHNLLDVLHLLLGKLSPRSVHVKGLTPQQILMDIQRPPFNVLPPLLLLLMRRHRGGS